MPSHNTDGPTSPFFSSVEFTIQSTEEKLTRYSPWRLSAVMRPIGAPNDSQDVEVVQAVKLITASQTTDGVRTGKPRSAAYLTPGKGRFLASLCTHSTCPCQHPRMGATVERRNRHHNTMSMFTGDESPSADGPWCELSATGRQGEAIYTCKTSLTMFITLRASTSYLLTAHHQWQVDIRTLRLMSEHHWENERGANERVFHEHTLTVRPIAPSVQSPRPQLAVIVPTRKRVYEQPANHEQEAALPTFQPSSLLSLSQSAQHYDHQSMAAFDNHHPLLDGQLPPTTRQRRDVPEHGFNPMHDSHITSSRTPAYSQQMSGPYHAGNGPHMEPHPQQATPPSSEGYRAASTNADQRQHEVLRLASGRGEWKDGVPALPTSHDDSTAEARSLTPSSSQWPYDSESAASGLTDGSLSFALVPPSATSVILPPLVVSPFPPPSPPFRPVWSQVDEARISEQPLPELSPLLSVSPLLSPLSSSAPVAVSPLQFHLWQQRMEQLTHCSI
jgi:hypothetical protein